MAISTDGGSDDDEPTRNCPDCGSELDYDIITEHGTRYETTEYMGWWCENCGKGMTECEHCDSLHHPDRTCEPQRKAEFEQARDVYGQKAQVPGVGEVSLDECETQGEGTLIYVEEDGCPDCGGDVIHELIPDENFARFPANYEFTAILLFCTEDDCTHRKP